MLWDPTNCKLAIAPNAWSKGNGISDKNTGNFPSYPNGAYQNCVLTNMATGYGYVYNTGDGYLNFDGVDDYIEIEQPLIFLDQVQKFTIEMWINADAIDVLKTIFEYSIDVTHSILIAISDSGDGLLWCRISNGDSNSYAYWAWGTEGAQAGTWYHIVWRYDGTQVSNTDKLRIYFNGDYKTTSYAGNIPTITADFTTEKARIGKHTYNAFPGKIGWFAIYADALTPSCISTNYSLGKDMEMEGNNASDSMVLAPFKFDVLPFDSESEYIPAFQNKTCYNCILSQPEFVAVYCLDVSEPHIASCPLCSHEPQLPMNTPVCSNCEHGL